MLQQADTNCSDSACIQRILVGDNSAFDVLVHRYSAPLSRLIYSFVQDSFQTEDILQDVFLQLCLSLPDLHTRTTLKPWLYRVARNRCQDKLRRRLQNLSFSELEAAEEDDEMPIELKLTDPELVPEDMAILHEARLHIIRAIQDLPPHFRQVVLLRYRNGLTYTQIGRVLNMPTSTAKTYFRRAKPFLRTMLNTLQPSAASPLPNMRGKLSDTRRSQETGIHPSSRT